jgi:hypothetical protein
MSGTSEGEDKVQEAPGRTVPSTFRVSVQKMVESGNRITWWVCLDRGDRPIDAMPWDKGRITPYMSAIKERADFTAEEFAEFLGVEVTPTASETKD